MPPACRGLSQHLPWLDAASGPVNRDRADRAFGARPEDLFAVAYRFREVLDDVIAQLTRDPIPTEYSILGHSFGAILAYEAVHELAARGQAPPGTSSSPPPVRLAGSERSRCLCAEDNRALLASLAHLGGTPHEILADSEAVEFFAPILRADLKALFDYRHTRTNRLACDLSVILASTDTVATPHDANLWAETTDGSTSTHIIEGGHFAALENPATVAPVSTGRSDAESWAGSYRLIPPRACRAGSGER